MKLVGKSKQLIEVGRTKWKKNQVHSKGRANNVCTRLGVCAAFFEQFLGLKLVPAKRRCLVPPGCRACRDTPAPLRGICDG